MTHLNNIDNHNNYYYYYILLHKGIKEELCTCHCLQCSILHCGRLLQSLYLPLVDPSLVVPLSCAIGLYPLLPVCHSRRITVPQNLVYICHRKRKLFLGACCINEGEHWVNRCIEARATDYTHSRVKCKCFIHNLMPCSLAQHGSSHVHTHCFLLHCNIRYITIMAIIDKESSPLS